MLYCEWNNKDCLLPNFLTYFFLCHRETIVEEDEQPSGLLFGREGWNRRTFPLPTSTPLGGLPTIAQSPYGSMSSLRQSQDSLRASQEQLRASQEGSKCCWDLWDFIYSKLFLMPLFLLFSLIVSPKRLSLIIQISIIVKFNFAYQLYI